MCSQNNDNWVVVNGYPNYKINELGEVVNIKTGHKLSIVIHKHGYHAVRLWHQNKTRLFKLYRLIAIHFIPNPENKREVNHKDGNRMNYAISNLEWVTPSENMKHAVATGLARGQFGKGFEHKYAKLTKEDVLDIRDKRNNKRVKLKDLALMYKISERHVWGVANYETHI